MKGLARLIQQHAPVLEELSVGRNDLAVAVAKAYEQEKVLNRRVDAVGMSIQTFMTHSQSP